VERELEGHSDSVDQLVWSPHNEHLLATTSADKTLRLWDTRSGKQTQRVDTAGENINISWSPNGQCIAVGNKDDHLSFVETRKHKVIKKVKFPYEANEFAWSPNSRYFFLTTGQDDATGTVEIMPFGGAAVLGDPLSLRAHSANCYCLAFDPTHRYFAVGGADALVSLWDLASLTCVRAMGRLQWPVRTLTFSHDGSLLVSAAEDHFIDIADTSTGEQLYSLESRCAMNSVAWHPTKFILAYAGDEKGDTSRMSGYRDSRHKEELPQFIKLLHLNHNKK